MVDAYTTTTAISNAVVAAYDKRFHFALRSQPFFRMLSDVQPAEQTSPGSSVTLEIWQDLAEQTSTLTETVDPDAIAIGNPDTVTITLNEYGAAVLRTRKVKLFSLSDVDPAIANQVAYNAHASIDTVVQTELRQGSNLIQKLAGTVSYITNSDGATVATTMVDTDTMDSDIARLATTKLRAQLALPKKGTYFAAYIHPEVSHDLREESGSNTNWREPHVYSAAGNIWAGELGAYEGAFYVESPRCYNAVDAGTGDNTIRRFRTYYCGRQALAEAVGEEFHTVFGPIVDKLGRFRPVGWYGVAGWKRFREECLIRVETTSSVNSGA